jgi:hypothetical protein
VRNCDPGADERLPSDRASRCWNDDLAFRCRGQLGGLCAPSRRIVLTYERDRRPLQIGGVEQRMGIVSAVTATNSEHCLSKCGSSDIRRIQQSSSHLSANSGLTDIKRAANLFESICAPQRIASFFDLFMPLFAWNAHLGNPEHDVEIPRGFWHRTSFEVATTSSQSVPRTHSLIRVSNEKRNVDECPPTRGKSNRHR